MEKIRIGNDIAIKWAIYAADMLAEVRPETPTPYDLTGRDLSLYVEMGAIRTRIRDFEVNGNEVRFTFFGMYQTTEGVYRLTLVENEGMRGMHTVDYEDAFRLDLPEDVEPLGACECQEEDLMKVFEQDGFELVDSSDLMGGQSEDNVEVVYLSLKSTMLLSGAIDIVDSLDSTRKDAALSANQGRVLSQLIEEVNTTLAKDEAVLTRHEESLTRLATEIHALQKQDEVLHRALQDNADAIFILTADADTDGSVDNKIRTAVSWGRIENYDIIKSE